MSPVWRMELARLPWRVVGWAVALGLVLIAVSHALVPRLPATAIGVLETGFRVRGLRAVLLLNDHLAVYAVVFFLGLALLHDALVAPRETHQLAIWLARPISRPAFVRLRALPSLAVTGGVGALLSAAMALSVAATPAGGDASVAGALAGGLLLTLLALVVLGATLAVQLRASDGFQAVLVAVIVWMVTLMPASVLMYRPDVFAPHPRLTAALVVPANLLWVDAALPLLFAPAVVAALAALAVGVTLAGAALDRDG